MALRGSQSGFTELLDNNIALIRRFILDSQLKVERSVLGRVTKTPYCIMYMEAIADSAIVQEVKNRLARAQQHVDKILDSGYIEELIRDMPSSPFPTVNTTEKPDRTAAHLLEGKVAILVNNSPIVLTVPALLAEFLDAPDDYYGNFLLQSAIRLLRYLAFWLSLTLPTLYVAVLCYHHELLSTSFLSTVMTQRQGVPLPTIVEVLVMEVTFEILREAGLRLPRPIGQAVSIVGALVIGQAAVQAGVVMATTVIIVAATAIMSFTIPGFAVAGAIRLLRFPLLILVGIFGLPGFVLGIMMILFHLVNVRSFGIVYTATLAPRKFTDIFYTLVRAPYYMTQLRIPWMAYKKSR